MKKLTSCGLLALLLSLPVYAEQEVNNAVEQTVTAEVTEAEQAPNEGDRKSTRLNSSHVAISYAVFCLKKKKGDAEVGAVGEHGDQARDAQVAGGGSGPRQQDDRADDTQQQQQQAGTGDANHQARHTAT